MNTKPRIASVIDLSLPVKSQKATTTTRPLLRPVQFTEAQIKDPTFLTKQLVSMHQELSNTTQAVRSHPEQAPVTFKNIACPTGGAKITLVHNFGAYADYIVTRWSGDGVTFGPNFVSDEKDVTGSLTTANQLVLHSFTAGTATIRVFPGA